MDRFGISEQVAALVAVSLSKRGTLTAWGTRMTCLVPGEREIHVPVPKRERMAAEYKINIVAPGVGGTLSAPGKVLKAGKATLVSSADGFAVKDGFEKLCATLPQTLFIIPLSELRTT
jgi:hypothetical protein